MKDTIYILVLLIVAGILGLQQDTIESLVASQATETHRAGQMSTELAQLRRELNFLKNERARRLDKVARQADLNTNLLRLGPAGRRKLLADRKVRFYLGL